MWLIHDFRVCLCFILIYQICSVNSIMAEDKLATQNTKVESERMKCKKKHEEDVSSPYTNTGNRTTCPAIWDGILCWDETQQNTTVAQQCPDFVIGFDRLNETATKQCLPNGQWFLNAYGNATWTNYNQCFSTTTPTIMVPLPSFNASLIQEYTPIIKTISRIGYFVSFSTLLVAFSIMFCIKKLHCARNKLHMHLFASFIFRAGISFLKDFLFIHGVGMSSDLVDKDGGIFFYDQVQSNNWECKMLTSFWQYFITANYSWILMEGIYLHNLILLALFSESNNSIKFYIILGWGLPMLVVGSWIAARLILEDNYCWTTHADKSIFLIIRIPTMISNLINLILFINIARVLLSKLRSPVTEEAKLYRKWARSTLVLVPLFGVHYALFLGMSYSMGINEIVELIWLFFDQLFASFQGFFVAVLYCFLNGEVKTELRPHINNFVSVWLAAPLSVFFNCKDFSGSSKARPSVCTTLSCSSLYTSSVTQKYQNRRSRWDISQPSMKSRHSIIQENYYESCPNCELNVRNPELTNNSKLTHNCEQEKYCFCTNGLTQATEMTACLNPHTEITTKSDPQHDLEMITIVGR